MSVRYVDQRRAAKRLSWVLLFSIGVAMTVSLYYIKTRAQNAKNEVKRLERAIKIETSAIKVLEAEYAYLTGPERLSGLSEKTLLLEPITPERTAKVSDISSLYPLSSIESDEE